MSEIKLEGEQVEAFDRLHQWFSSDRSQFILKGWAGTGKTTLLGKLIEQYSDKYRFRIVAPTGKAAYVLQRKVPPNIEVTTVHRLLYIPNSPGASYLSGLRMDLNDAECKLKELAGNDALVVKVAQLKNEIAKEKKRLAEINITFKDKEEIDHSDNEIVVCDESSMVPGKMAADLLGRFKKVIFLGDEGQLPVVGGTPWFHNQAPDAELITIRRQAEDNSIIRLAHAIRNGGVTFSQIKAQFPDIIIGKSDFDMKEYLVADQILCGKNETRMHVNRIVREALGYRSKLPRQGEKMIFKKNDYESGRVNGQEFRMAFNATEDTISYNADGVLQHNVAWYPYHCRKHYDTENKLVEEPRELRHGLAEATFGHCITVHSSQGSEYPHVILCDDEMRRSDKTFRRQFIYTAITRAKEKLTWIR